MKAKTRNAKPAPTIQMVFELASGQPCPVLPRDRHSNRVRVPDGRRWLSLADASAACGRPERRLRAEYFAALSDLLSAAEVAALLSDDVPCSAAPFAGCRFICAGSYFRE